MKKDTGIASFWRRLVILLILTLLFIPVTAVHGQGEDPSQLMIAVFNQAADSMGWDSLWRAGPGNVHTLTNQVIQLSLTVLTEKTDVFCGNRTSMTVITYFPVAGEAQQYLIFAYANAEQVEFHGLEAYRYTNISQVGNYKFQEWIAWAMGNYSFVVGDTFDCPGEGLPGDELDPMPLAEALYAAAVNHGLGGELPPGPNPPTPSPLQPEPVPVNLDAVIEQINNLISNPTIPITGAVAGTILSLLIAALNGGLSISPPPAAPRNPRPGQVGPDGRVWSSQGWVSKAAYDHQQKWLQKGWRLNPQTGNLEVQPGAVDDSGKVWYKLPYDEGNSHYWVDKAKVDECERNLAEGYVYDHGQGGWIKSGDLKDYNAQRKTWEDQNLSPEARQRDHERLMQQVQEGIAQDAKYQKIIQDIKQAQDKLDEASRQMIQDDMDFNQRIAELNKRTLKLAEIVGGPLNSMKNAADTAIDVLGGIPGPPTYIRYTYKAVTGFADKAFTDRSLWSGVKGALEATGKEYVGDKLGELLPTPGIEDLPEVGERGVLDLIESTGEEEIKQLSLNYAKGQFIAPGVDEIFENGKEIITGQKDFLDLFKGLD